MKIAYFTDTFLPRIDGITFTIFEHSQSLSLKGHKIKIYAPSYPKDNKVQHQNGITIERHPSIPFPAYKGTRIPFPKTWSMYQSIKKFNPDIVHFHTPGTIGLMGILLAKILKKPLIGTYHTLFSESLVYASPQEFFKQLGITVPNIKIDKSNTGNAFAKKITWQTVNKVYSQSDLVLAPSPPIKDLLISQDFKKKIEIISSGIDTQTYSPSPKINDGYTILHVGRIGYEKNVDVIIKSFKLVLKEIPQAKLIIAGDGPALKELKELSRKLGVNKNIKFTGFVSRKDLPSLYTSASVFFTASTFETLGLVILEAMSSGLPIVAVDKYAVPWLVKQNENGFLAKPSNKKELSRYLVRILKDKKLAKRLGKNSRKFATAHDTKKTVIKLENIYKKAILDYSKANLSN